VVESLNKTVSWISGIKNNLLSEAEEDAHRILWHPNDPSHSGIKDGSTSVGRD
jgi:hypothetical protein